MGLFSDLFDAFTGESQREDITAASLEATQRRREAARQATETTQGAVTESIDFLRPDIEAGRGALNQLQGLIGLGDGTSAEAVNALLQDPVLQGQIAQGVRTADAGAAARGAVRSGAQQKALFRLGRDESQNFIRNRINDLFQLSGTGTNVAGQAAGTTFQGGRDVANIQFGTGQQEANQAVGLGNALAQSRSIPINNILGVFNAASNVASAASGFPNIGGGRQTNAIRTDAAGRVLGGV